MANIEKKKINIGLCGFGFMGKTHAYAVENIKYFYGADIGFEPRIFGLATTNIERTRKICSDYSFEYAAESVDELIDDKDIDVIDICTPNIYHYDTLKKAILAGKSIYCEKPLCIDLEQSTEIVQLAKNCGYDGKVYGMVFNNRYLAPVIRAKQIIDEGRLGRILSFSFSYLHNSATFTSRPASWKQNQDICGGGVGFDLGAHVIDLVHYLCGGICSVSALAQIAFSERIGTDGRSWQTNADEAFYMTAILKSGACGNINVSKLATGENDGLYFEIYGESGAIKFSLMEPNWLYFYDTRADASSVGGYRGFTRIECVGRYPAPAGNFPSPKAPVGWLRGHTESMFRFLEAYASGKNFSPSFEDGCRVAAVLDAAYRSAKESSVMKEVKYL